MRFNVCLGAIVPTSNVFAARWAPSGGPPLLLHLTTEAILKPVQTGSAPTPVSCEAHLFLIFLLDFLLLLLGHMAMAV